MTQFNAAQARKLVDDAFTARGEYLKAETEKCLQDIERAAKTGQSAMTFYKTDEVIVTRLRLLGFNVVHTHEQRDGDYLTITW